MWLAWACDLVTALWNDPACINTRIVPTRSAGRAGRAHQNMLLPLPKPVAAVYTFAVIADGSRMAKLDKPHDRLNLYSAKGLALQWVAQYAEIPFSQNMVIFRNQGAFSLPLEWHRGILG